MYSARLLLPIFAFLIALPFFSVPLLDTWRDSLPTCIDAGGGICLMQVPSLTVGLWQLIDITKLVIYSGALCGFFGFFYTIGKALESQTSENH